MKTPIHGINGSPGMLAFIWNLVLIAAFDTVTITSALFQSEQSRGYALWEVTLWEVSSAIPLLAMVPPLYRHFVRQTQASRPLFQTGLSHLGWFLGFFFIHVLTMALIRKGVYGLMGLSYDFTHQEPFEVALYEIRKDLLTYLLFHAVFFVTQGPQRLRDPVTLDPTPQNDPAQNDLPPLDPSGPDTLIVRIDGRTHRLLPQDISHILAAGNYVEIHAGGRVHFTRQTLAALETRLAPLGFLKIHRSCLLNPAAMDSFTPTRSGHLEIHLKTGGTVLASRRLRKTLMAALLVSD